MNKFRTRGAVVIGALLVALSCALLASAAPSTADIELLGALYPGATGSGADKFTFVDDSVFFRADDGTHGFELWKTDGSAAGTTLVKDINPGPASSYPGSHYSESIVESGGRLFFWANDGVHGEELWVSDGTSDGTALIADIRPGIQSSVVSALVPFEGGVLFNEYIPSSSDSGLWRSDGTAAGAGLVKSVSAGWLTLVGDIVFFSGDDGVHGRELWSTDGTSDGTVMVKDILPGDRFASSRPTRLTEAGGRLFFVAGDYAYGDELWMSDGTEGGTVRLSDINPGPNRTPISNLTNVNGTLYFTARAPTYGESLWKSDGTVAGTTLVWDPDPASSNAGLINLTAMGDTLFFVNLYHSSGPELWKSDGTAAGTVQVADIGPPSSYWAPSWLTVVDSRLFFQMNDVVHGTELWVSDGTEAGTELAADIDPGAPSSNPGWLTAGLDSLFFSADDGVHGREPYKLSVVADTTPPVITVPDDMTLDATSPAGALVEFPATAWDETDGDVPVTCTPPSGSTFPIGDTTVECTATDAAGNSATASFTVHVQGADEQLGDLANAVTGIGPGTSLADKVSKAQAALAEGDDTEACEILNAFINQVEAQSGKMIEPATADALIADATRIRDVIGCSS